MSAGHNHRTITVRRDGIVHRVLHRTTLSRTIRLDRAEASRFVYAPTVDGHYRLSLLGFLHGLCGLTLDVRDEP